jgi:hypothetical protein
MKRLLKIRQWEIGIIILFIGFIIAALLHWSAAYHFPVPWNDESHFLMPAINLSENLSLAAPEQNAPLGMFWMPDGYYVFMGILFFVLPTSLEAARWVSFILALVFSGSLFIVARKLNISPLLSAGAIVVWLIMPRVVLMANVARMESLVLAITALALVMVIYEQFWAGVAVSSLASLAHPAGIPLFLSFATVALIFSKDIKLNSNRHFQWLIVGVVLAAWFFEALHFASNFTLAVDHLTYQMSRKASRGAFSFDKPAYPLIVLWILGMFTCWNLRTRGEAHKLAVLSLLFLLAVSLKFVSLIGREMWYWVYGNETASLLTFISFLGLLPFALSKNFVSSALTNLKWSKIAMISLVLVICLANARPSIISYSAHGMSIYEGTRKEWNEFYSQVETQLNILDKSLKNKAVVWINESSEMMLFIRHHKWKRLNFIHESYVTKLRDKNDKNRQPNYVIFTLHHNPQWLRELNLRKISNQFPQRDELIKIRSRNDNFELVILKNL